MQLAAIWAKGEKDFIGRGVSYCAECDGHFYKKQVVALEIDKHDLVFFNDQNMYSVSSSKLGEFLISW